MPNCNIFFDYLMEKEWRIMWWEWYGWRQNI